MKRSMSASEDSITGTIDANNNSKLKKIKLSEDQAPVTDAGTDDTAVYVLSDENILYEVLKHVDARALGAAGCVSKHWHRTAQDERLWELICTRDWANMGCGNNQLRSVVLALGGFRRLHAHYLWPLSKPSTTTTTSSSSSTVAAATSSTSAWPCLPPPRTLVLSKPTSRKTHWGKDEKIPGGESKVTGGELVKVQAEEDMVDRGFLSMTVAMGGVKG